MIAGLSFRGTGSPRHSLSPFTLLFISLLSIQHAISIPIEGSGMEKRLLEVRCPNQGCYPEASKTAAPNVTVESIPITTVTNIRLETAYRVVTTTVSCPACCGSPACAEPTNLANSDGGSSLSTYIPPEAPSERSDDLEYPETLYETISTPIDTTLSTYTPHGTPAGDPNDFDYSESSYDTISSPVAVALSTTPCTRTPTTTVAPVPSSTTPCTSSIPKSTIEFYPFPETEITLDEPSTTSIDLIETTPYPDPEIPSASPIIEPTITSDEPISPPSDSPVPPPPSSTAVPDEDEPIPIPTLPATLTTPLLPSTLIEITYGVDIVSTLTPITQVMSGLTSVPTAARANSTGTPVPAFTGGASVGAVAERSVIMGLVLGWVGVWVVGLGLVA